MFCSQCGAKVESDSNYCPSCGARLTSDEEERGPLFKANPSNSSTSPSSTISEPEQSSQMRSKRRMPLWFKILASLAFIALIGVTIGILFTESWVEVVDQQLATLRQGDISKAYYAFTSKDFQEATSLDQFNDFVKMYPIFLNNQSARFTQRSIEHDIGILKGTLTSHEHKSAPVEYQLIKEENKWKILSIRLLQSGMLESPEEPVNAQQLVDIVKAQLQAIANKDLSTAYYRYSSHEFKEATSQEVFQDFIKRYPILTHYSSVTFRKPAFRNGISTLAAILKSNQGIVAYLKYYFIYEDHRWAIWSMRILSTAEGEIQLENDSQMTQVSSSSTKSTTPPPPMSFSHLALGLEIDTNGIVKKPTTHFESNSDDIYVNIEIENGIRGTIVYLNFQHLDSGSFIPAQATIDEDGDNILMSVFSPPAGGWPKGQYKLVVTSSGGLNKVVDFEIE